MQIPISLLLTSLQTISSAKPITGNANVAGDVLQDRRGSNVQSNIAIAYRVIQNTSGATVNVAFGVTASAGFYHVQVPDGQQFNISSLERVSVWCASNWTVSVIEQSMANGAI